MLSGSPWSTMRYFIATGKETSSFTAQRLKGSVVFGTGSPKFVWQNGE